MPVRNASGVESPFRLNKPAFMTKKMIKQRRRPAKRTPIDLGNTNHSSVAKLSAGKL